MQQEETRVIGCSSRCSRSLIGERRILPVLKLDHLRPPEMLLETASRRNCDTALGALVGRELHRALLPAKLQLGVHREVLWGYVLGGKKVHAIKNLQEIHFNNETDTKFNFSYNNSEVFMQAEEAFELLNLSKGCQIYAH